MAGQTRPDLEELKQPLLAMDPEDDYGKTLLFMVYNLYYWECAAFGLINATFLTASIKFSASIMNIQQLLKHYKGVIMLVV